MIPRSSSPLQGGRRLGHFELGWGGVLCNREKWVWEKVPMIEGCVSS
jgi:hypothetical protein